MQGVFKLSARSGKRVRFYDVPYLPTVFLAVNMVMIHVGLPLLLAGEGFRWLKRRSALLPREFWFMVACYAYVALLANISSYGENMRFRLSIEPVIWAISTYLAAWLAPLVVRASRAHEWRNRYQPKSASRSVIWRVHFEDRGILNYYPFSRPFLPLSAPFLPLFCGSRGACVNPWEHREPAWEIRFKSSTLRAFPGHGSGQRDRGGSCGGLNTETVSA